MELKVAQYGPSTTHWDLASVPSQAIEPITGPAVLSTSDPIDIDHLRAETISTYPVFDEGKYVRSVRNRDFVWLKSIEAWEAPIYAFKSISVVGWGPIPITLGFNDALVF